MGRTGGGELAGQMTSRLEMATGAIYRRRFKTGVADQSGEHSWFTDACAATPFETKGAAL